MYVVAASLLILIAFLGAPLFVVILAAAILGFTYSEVDLSVITI